MKLHHLPLFSIVRLITPPLYLSRFLVLFSCLVALHVPSLSFAQPAACGAPSESSGVAKKGKDEEKGKESVISIYDRFGNTYDSKTLQVPVVPRGKGKENDCSDCNEGTMDIGVFRLYFMDIINHTGHGFDESAPLCANRKQVLCQVFNDLNSFLTVSSGVPRVNVRIKESGVLDLSNTANPLASASSFYVIPAGVTEGIVDGETWKALNGDDDPYLYYPPALLQSSGIGTPPGASPGNAGYFHGSIEFFFPVNAEYYHTNLSTLPPAGVIDMYTVTLHEVMHMLGFASLIDETGESRLSNCPACYSRYDSYLKFKSNDQSVIAQSSGTGTACSDLSYDGPASMGTGCANGVIFDGLNNPNQDVFTPTTWASGSSLSHFDCADGIGTCPFGSSQNVLVFCNNGGPAFTRRHPSQAEANTFCDLGYSRGNSWSNSGNPTITQTYTGCSTTSCPFNIVAYNDYTYPDGLPLVIDQTLVANLFHINPTINDFNATGVACASVVSGPGSIILYPDNPGVISYVPSSTAFVGYITIKYRAYLSCSSGTIESNDAYVFIHIDLPPTCLEDGCNLICGGDFESTTFPFVFGNFAIDRMFANNTADIYRRDAQTGVTHLLDVSTGANINTTFLLGGCPNIPIPPPYSPANTTYIGFGSDPNDNPSVLFDREGLKFHLNHPMLPGNQYVLTFWARGASTSCSSSITVWGDDVSPCDYPIPTLLNGMSSPCGFTSVVLGNSPVLNDMWQQYSITIMPLQVIEYLVMTNPLPLATNYYTLMDDLVLSQQPAALNLSVSSEADNSNPCTGGKVTITYKVQLPAGVSTNPGVINVQAVIPAGFSVISPSVFSATGQYTIPANTLVQGVPYSLVLTLQLNPGVVVAGNAYNVTLNILNDGSACFGAGSSSNSVTIEPVNSLLSINTFFSNPFPASGDEVTIFVEVCNAGKNKLTDVSIKDILPATLTFVSSPDFILSGNTLTAQSLTIPGTEPGLPPTCIVLSFLATVKFNSLCSLVENCASATYAGCAIVSDCGQLANDINADFSLSDTDNLDAALPANEAVNHFITISGTFTILNGTEYTFKNCKMVMQPGAKIILEAGATLNLVSTTHLYGCDNLWEGIVVNEGATLKITTGSIVQDARRAIDIPATAATLRLANCFFTNNYIGIYANYGNDALISGSINYTTFECTDDVYQYNKPGLAGIYVSRVTLPTIQRCKFFNLNYGIYASTSPLKVMFGRFEKIQPYYNQAFSGTGIVSFGKIMTSLHVEGNPLPSGVAYDGCTTGIYSNNNNLFVSRITMRDVATGVDFKILNAPGEYPTRISTLNVICSDYGIKGMIYSPQQNPLISGNEIRVTDANEDGIGAGISIISDIVQSAVRIYSNRIYMDKGKYGVRLKNLLYVNLNRNGFGDDPHDPMELNGANTTGFHLENIHEGLVTCNHIKDGMSTVGTTAMDIYNSPGLTFECNEVSKTATGIRVNGVCNTPEHFQGNSFGNHTTGFQIAQSGRLGTQTHQGNSWDGLATLEAQNLGNPLLSLFVVAQNVPEFFPNPLSPPYNPLSSTNWFTPQSTNSSYDCAVSDVCSKTPTFDEPPVTDIVDRGIATGAFNKSANSAKEGLQWLSQSYLYEKLTAYPDLANQDVLFSGFMNLYSKTAAGRLFNVHAQTRKLADFNGDTLPYLTQTALDIKIYADLLVEIDSLLNIAVDPAIITELEQKQANLMHASRKRRGQAELFEVKLAELIAKKSDQLLTKSDAVAPTNIAEDNYKEVNRIWLKAIGMDQLDALQGNASTLYDIAHQCPYTGGWAVYWARGLYDYIEELEYDDDQLCVDSEDRSANVPTETVLALSPNPARDNISFFWSAETGASTALTIVNSLQATVYQSLVQGSNCVVNVSAFQPGIYYAVIIREGKKVQSKPFIIMK